MDLPLGLTVILYASRPCADTAELKKRFERYASAAGRRIRVIEAGSTEMKMSGEEVEETAVLWDASAGVPPKEIEKLTEGLAPGGWRAGVRFGDRSIARGSSRLHQALGRTLSLARRTAGLVSDAHPPCLAVPGAVIAQNSTTIFLSVPPSKWSAALIASAGRAHQPVAEVPVMWGG